METAAKEFINLMLITMFKDFKNGKFEYIIKQYSYANFNKNRQPHRG